MIVFASPIRFEVSGMNEIERKGFNNQQIAPKVEIDQKTFDAKQTDELNQLRSQSGALFHDIEN